MNWKQTLFWSFSAAAIFYYFLLFGVFVFVGQEEMQLFIPEWWYIREFLFQPGGFCAVAGQWIIQYYRQPMSAVVFHTVLLVGCGFMVYRILRCFSDKTYLLFLSLLPVLYLVKMSIHGGVFGGRDGWRGFDAFSFVGLAKGAEGGFYCRIRNCLYTFFMWADRASICLLRFLIYAVSLTPLQNVAAKIGRLCLLDPSAFYLFV